MTASLGAAIFLDRDGVLIRDVHYLCRDEQIEVLAGVAEALRLLPSEGFRLVVVTNQSVVARGKVTEAGLREIHRVLRERLGDEGAKLDAIYYCPHHPTAGIGVYKIACACRKPNVAMIERAARELRLDPKNSYLVGDQDGDMELAARVGAQGMLIREATTAGSEVIAGAVPAFDNLLQAARWIVSANCASRLGASES